MAENNSITKVGIVSDSDSMLRKVLNGFFMARVAIIWASKKLQEIIWILREDVPTLTVEQV